jgi:hypothetical protein
MSGTKNVGWNAVSQADPAKDKAEAKALNEWNAQHNGDTATVATESGGSAGRLILRDKNGKAINSFAKGEKLTVDGQAEYRKLGDGEHEYVHVHDSAGHSGWVAADKLNIGKPVNFSSQVKGYSMTPVGNVMSGGKSVGTRYRAGDNASLMIDGKRVPVAKGDFVDVVPQRPPLNPKIYVTTGGLHPQSKLVWPENQPSIFQS